MLAASICREVHFTVLPATLVSTVPRCLFGSPNAKDTVELLQEALDMERSRFSRRWGIDPRTEDKENCVNSNNERVDKSPRKRSTPYSRQTNIHEFWRSRKSYDATSKKSMASSNVITKHSSSYIEKPASISSSSSSSSASSPSSSSSL